MIVPYGIAILLIASPFFAGVLYIVLRSVLTKTFKPLRMAAFFAGVAGSILVFAFHRQLIVVNGGNVEKIALFGSALYQSSDGQVINYKKLDASAYSSIVVNTTGLDLTFDYIHYQSEEATKRGLKPRSQPSIEIPAHTTVVIPVTPNFLPHQVPPSSTRSQGSFQTYTWLHFADGAPPIY